MRHVNHLTLVTVFLCAAFSLNAQEDVLTLVPYDGTEETFLNAQFAADTTETNGLLPNRVYELQRGGVYLSRAILTIQSGQTLRLRAEAGSGPKPIIYLWETGTGDNPTRPPGNFVVLAGGNLEMTDIALVGYYEPEPDRLDGVQGGLINTTAVGSSIILDGVILSNVAGQPVRTGFNAVKVQATNSIFANMGALTTSNLGAGKGFDLREATIDTFIVQNNTFVNYQDRAIRHYNFGNPEVGTGPIRYGLIEHNTFINGMGYHGLLSLGNVGTDITISNNLFVDGFALGEDSTDASRAAEWANTGEQYVNGNNKITWIFSAPNDTTEWYVHNNYFVISDEGRAFLDANEFGTAAQLSDHIQAMLGAQGGDPASAFTEVDLVLANAPALMVNFLDWYVDPAGADKSKDVENFDVEQHDFDRRTVEFYRDTMDASYATDSPAFTGSDRGFPAGDLNWFPDKKAEWEMVTNVRDRDNLPASFMLSQNYPNPFNPTTKIVFTLSNRTEVRLEVFDVLGRKVATLVDGVQEAGRHLIDFDGSALNSGVYFYRLKAGAEVQTKRMILVK
jgi:hypothetical protein